MNCSKLITAIGNIDDIYILEYAVDAVAKGKKAPSKKRWGMIAACFMFLVLTVLALPAVLDTADNPKEYINHYFEGYEEFSTVVPEGSLLNNLAQYNEYDLTYYGICESSIGTEFGKTDNYLSFNVVLLAENQMFAHVAMVMEPTGSIEEYSENQCLTDVVQLDDTMLYYGYNYDEECLRAVFEDNENMYTVELSSQNTEELVSLVKQIVG